MKFIVGAAINLPNIIPIIRTVIAAPVIAIDWIMVVLWGN